MTDQHLELVINAKVSPPSFDPLDSDSLINAIHVEQLVGTMVRLHPSGRYEPYLSERWTVSNDQNLWTFKLKEGLLCQDGTPINASNFIWSLNTSIGNFAQHSTLPLIERLKGYGDFLSGKNKIISGIREVSEYEIEFHFESPVQSGLLEYFGLPFLGFYCPGNFDTKGRWKDKNKIISSAAYSLAPWDGQGSVLLIRRDDWVGNNKAPKSIVISRSPDIETMDTSEGKIILQFQASDSPALQKMQAIALIPTSLFAITLSPREGGVFSSLHNRQKFQEKVREVDFAGNKSQGLRTDRFYPHLSKSLRSEKKSIENSPLTSGHRRIKILGRPSADGTPSSFLRKLIEITLGSLDLEYFYEQTTSTERDLMAYRNQENWDIRPTNVDIGGGIENQLVKFMFCSKLGVSFPDPSGRICDLVTEYEAKYGEAIPTEEMENYLNRFDQIIEEDAAVIPILKSGKTWLISPNIDPDFLSPTTAVPYFDLIKMK